MAKYMLIVLYWLPMLPSNCDAYSAGSRQKWNWREIIIDKYKHRQVPVNKYRLLNKTK